jgi:carbon monoxide dehydrogenase subunit G
MSSPTDMTATVVFRVGPVKATFGGNVTLSDLDPPNSYRISGEGSGGLSHRGSTTKSASMTPMISASAAVCAIANRSAAALKPSRFWAASLLDAP